MKKTLALILTLVLVLSASLTVYAAPGSFFQSPSKNKAPILVEFTNTSPDCFAKLYITAYADRLNLDEESRLLMEEAYSSIATTSDLGQICADLNQIAADLGLSTEALTVADLFDIDYTDCDIHSSHGSFTIKLAAETIEKYVALMQRVGNEWVVVENARIEGEYLIFESDVLSTYAIVLNADSIVEDGGDGEGDFPITGGVASNVFFALALVSAAGLTVVLLKLRKKAK